MILPVFALQIRSGGGGGLSLSIYLWVPKSVFIPFCVPPPTKMMLLFYLLWRSERIYVCFILWSTYNADPDGLLPGTKVLVLLCHNAVSPV